MPAKTVRTGDAMTQLRAVLSAARNHGVRIDKQKRIKAQDERKQAFHFRQGMQGVLLAARTRSNIEQATNFFQSIEALTKKEQVRFSRQPIGDDYLRLLVEPRAIPIQDEIRWAAEVSVRSFGSLITTFLAYKQRIENEFVSDHQGAALRLLSELEEQVGISLWSTQLRIPLLQETQGLEAQKTYVTQIKAIAKAAVWPFFSTAVSQQCEPTVSIGWFLDETRRKLRRTKQSDIRTYLEYKLLGLWPIDLDGCATVLRVEQNHHPIDIYETCLNILQQLTVRPVGSEIDSEVKHSLRVLQQFCDPRIAKLSAAHGLVGLQNLDIADFSLLDTLLAENTEPADLSALIRREALAPLSLTSILSSALAAGDVTPRSADRKHRNLRSMTTRGISSWLRRSRPETDQLPSAGDHLRKHSYVYAPLSFSYAAKNFILAVSEKSFEHSTKLLQLCALNSREWGILDAIYPYPVSVATELNRRINGKNVLAYCSRYKGLEGGDSELRFDATIYATAANYYLSDRFGDASSALDAFDSSSIALSRHAALLSLNAAARTGEIEKAAELISKEHIRHYVPPDSLPVEDVLSNLTWPQLRPASTQASLSIALSLVQEDGPEDQIRTYRRFAIEAFLCANNMELPSEFRTTNVEDVSPELVFFLSKVCSTTMLDMLPSIDSSRQVLEERRSICGFLMTVDKRNAAQYEQEVLDISKELTVQDGLRTIDGSRVHVDIDALTDAVKADLAEGFSRYLSLIKDQDETSIDSFAKILKDIARHEEHPKYLLAMPVSEADELLISMILRTRKRFLFDVPHGLDSYLSKRIRHGSIIGFIRTPAECEKMMAQRNADGSYRDYGTWADALEDPQERAELRTALITFSRAIDQHLLRIKDVLLHVKSETKPLGMLDSPLTPPTYFLIRSVARKDRSVDAFVSTIFQSLWGLLGPSLIQVQNFLSNDTARFVSEQFQILRTKAQSILRDQSHRTTFDAAAGRASAAMQVAITSAAGWFEPSVATPRKYSLSDVVDIVVASVRARAQGFAPDVNVSSSATITFSEQSLPVISDVLYIAFGNIAGRANMGPKPKVDLTIEHDSARGLISLHVSNDVTLTVAEEVYLSHLETLRSQIGTPDGENFVRLEDGSGMHKLASIASQSPEGRLEFGYADGRFNLTVHLPYSEETDSLGG